MKLGILTCSKLPNLLDADRKLIPLFEEKGYQIEVVIWDDLNTSKIEYDVLLFRNTWDYYEKEDSFRSWINHLNRKNILTVNPLPLIEWNLHKFYLKELEQKGIPILQTFFLEKGKTFDFENQISLECEELVLKPAFSAGSYLTTRFNRNSWKEVFSSYQKHFSCKDFLLQPFVPEIQTLGETSLIFFNGTFSHAINKKPVGNDFRVQVQYGGVYTNFEPEPELMLQAEKILKALPCASMYARVDGIILNGQLKLMEVELIEPDLYFNHVPGAKLRFVNAFDTWLINSS